MTEIPRKDYILALDQGTTSSRAILFDRQGQVAAMAQRWADLLASSYNVLPMDEVSFRHWAKLMHRRSDTLYEDAMIAATAIRHQLKVVTRNVADFSTFGVQLLNPFESPV